MKKKAVDSKFVWNVFIWDVNSDELKVYDVVPRFMEFYKKEKVKPTTLAQLNEFLDEAALYMFWSKCEYEIIFHGWPKFKNDEKVDVYTQLKLNWDVFVKEFWKEISKKTKAKKNKKK